MVSLESMTMSARAKDNQVARKGEQLGTTKKNSAELSPVETRLELAKLAGVSCDTSHRFHAYH